MVFDSFVYLYRSGVSLLIFYLFLFSFLIGLGLFPRLIQWAVSSKFVDAPDGVLKTQKNSVPYLGGVGVACATLIPFFFFKINSFLFPVSLRIGLVGALFLFCVGLYDDKRNLSPGQKFILQFVCSLIFVLFLPFQALVIIPGLLTASPLLASGIKLFWLVSLTNAYNLLDIMDGSLVVFALVPALFIVIAGLVLGEIIMFAVTLVGALCAFFIYNRPPARIYLGDAGSLFVGYLLGVLTLLFPWDLFHRGAQVTPGFLFLIPACEVTALIVIRWYKNIRFFNGSRDHYAHYLLDKQWEIGGILCFVFLITSVLGTVLFLFLLEKISFLSLLFFSIGIVFFWFVCLYKPEKHLFYCGFRLK